MNIFTYFETQFAALITQLGASGHITKELDISRVVFELPRDPDHGDLATNAAMVLAKSAAMKPRELAVLLSEELKKIDGVDAVEIAGPGFINLQINPLLWAREISDILTAGYDYGRNNAGQGANVNIEYVSANPTGPLHAAHARGAVIGDALAGLMAFSGWQVTKEYYVNDAGGQVDILARSVYLRYCEALGDTIEIEAGLYPGAYLKDVGTKLAAKYGDKFHKRPEAEWLSTFRLFSVSDIMEGIKDDLQALGIQMDRFSSERELVESGAVQKAIDKLKANGHVYTGVLQPPKGKEPEDWEPREQLLFRSTEFGDDTDRPLQKSNGSWTYFASDVSYHFDKLERTKGPLIDILGVDHGGYLKRMTAAVEAISGQKNMLDIRFCQLVNLMENGKPVKMSKRAGNFVTVRDVIDAVGSDVIRFIMLTRRNDQTLDFDYAKVTEQSRDNPVFYVQYAHARACSVLRQIGKVPHEADLSVLKDPAELAVLKMLASWPKLVESAARAHEAHRIAFFLVDLASSFHSLWNAGRENPELRFILDDNQTITAARLQLVKATSLVIATGLNVLSIKALDEM
ncbi:arginine--tRNA ligase [Candidatus Puniceispirillum marinum]|uniref:Arginine--tRNA ligase n=1 Tax=Puniceispirillum marinum (strain IMCC1322) TaxID=488538 RepID=D5BQV0_PUNMI|nr:arginine--tRNA ligase [Candidatus Puniceispirillum marinum]ADE38664.1 Arginyl-tRNA synthetase [Candidatus Puniceispirillum marinum IMCC1322]